jgi:hypothetical protein
MTFKYFTDLRFLAPAGQPPLTLPEIAQRMGVHPHYYENGITVSKLEQLPTVQELFPKGYNQVDPNAVDWVRPFDNPGMPRTDELPPQYDLEQGRSAIIDAWQNKGTILARVDPIQPPTWKEDENGVPRFETGQYAGQEVFIKGPGIPQWHVNIDSNRIVPVATVPPGGAFQAVSHDETAGQGGTGGDGESGSGSYHEESGAGSHDGESGGPQEEPSPASEQPSHEPSYTSESTASTYHEPSPTSEESSTYHEPSYTSDSESASSSYQPSYTSEDTTYHEPSYASGSTTYGESSLTSEEDSAGSTYEEDQSGGGESDTEQSDYEEPSYEEPSYEETSGEFNPVEEDNSSFNEEEL